MTCTGSEEFEYWLVQYTIQQGKKNIDLKNILLVDGKTLAVSLHLRFVMRNDWREFLWHPELSCFLLAPLFFQLLNPVLMNAGFPLNETYK